MQKRVEMDKLLAISLTNIRNLINIELLSDQKMQNI
jgi:hypothetical protein